MGAVCMTSARFATAAPVIQYAYTSPATVLLRRHRAAARTATLVMRSPIMDGLLPLNIFLLCGLNNTGKKWHQK